MKYRSEIDGLRAIAVSSVVLFHAELPGFAGGFIGVDIFFVISGYLITTILRDDLLADRFSILSFYERRARRILPALLLMLLVTTVLSRLWMLPWQFEEYSTSAIAALTFWSNFFFWQTSGYFDIGVEEKPLLHTWSLSVEEQYYLLFPILFFLVWKRYGKNAALVAMIGCMLASFGLAEFARRDYGTANFFFTPTRVWELLLGATTALVSFREPSKSLRETLSLAGLIAIVLSIVLLSKYHPTPSVYLVPSLLGVAAILKFGSGTGIVARLLSLRAFVVVGMVSYSFYLWHQPVFALYRIRFGSIDNSLLAAGLVVLSFVLAVISYRTVETPFRQKSGTGFLIAGRIMASGLGGTVLSLLLVFSYYLVELDQGRFKGRELVYTKALVDVRTERQRTWNLFVNNAALKEELAQFSSSSDKTARVLIVGDSHAKDMFNAVYQNADLFENMEFRVVFFSDGCMVPSQEGSANHTRTCLGGFVTQHARLVDAATHVFFSMQWIKMDVAEVGPIIRTATEVFQDQGKTVVIASNSPTFVPSSPFLMARLFREGALTKNAADRIHFEHVIPKVGQVNGVLGEVARSTGAIYLSKFDYVCSQETASCHSLTPDGYAIFPDGGHYTVEGAAFLGKRMAEAKWFGTFR